MASHTCEIVTLAVRTPFTTHRTSGISDLIVGGVLCGGVRLGIDKKETEEEEGGSLKVWMCIFFLRILYSEGYNIWVGCFPIGNATL
jgi:hypothetical protein